MKTTDEFREWLNKYYSIHKGKWTLKTQLKLMSFMQPGSKTYDELHKYWSENVKNKN
jgi:hypothetical protein